ncbi:MAG: hypothetical protein AB1297_06010 [bacterium]
MEATIDKIYDFKELAIGTISVKDWKGATVNRVPVIAKVFFLNQEFTLMVLGTSGDIGLIGRDILNH